MKPAFFDPGFVLIKTKFPRAIQVQPVDSFQGAALAVGSRLGLTRYGPEQTMFLQYRPVLANDRLKTVFGYIPTRTSREAFDDWRAARRSY